MNHSLLSRAAFHIRETFVVTDQEAEEEARGLLDLIEAKGGTPDDWSVVDDLIQKDLGSRLQWRREADKAAAARRRADTVSAYNAHLDAIRPSWSKKW